MIGWFSAAVIGAFRSSLFRRVVPSAVRCLTVLLLLCVLPEFPEVFQRSVLIILAFRV